MNLKDNEKETYTPSGHQCVAGGTLRIAGFSIEDAGRQLDCHLQSLHLPREEYLAKKRRLDQVRLSAIDALQGLWDLVNGPF